MLIQEGFLYIHTYITYVPTYIHAYLHTYIHTCIYIHIIIKKEEIEKDKKIIEDNNLFKSF